MNFKKWLNTPRVLAIFDFDSTLALTPEQPSNWKHANKKDWWTHKDSLTLPYYDGMSLNPVILSEFRKARSSPDVKTVLLTGRSGGISWLVREVLGKNKLFGTRIIPKSNQKAAEEHVPHPKESGHEEYYKGDWFNEPNYPRTVNNKPNSDTIAHKEYIIKNQLISNETELVEIWEDRDEHLPQFIKIGHELLRNYPNLKNVIIHHVNNEKIETIPLRKTG